MIQRYSAVLLAAALLFAPFAGFGATAEETDARVREALGELQKGSSAARELGARAHGTLVFPRVIKGGVGIGAGYGRGALLVGGHTADYYNIASASVGFQLGVQEQSVVILFMTDAALEKFRASKGWKAGVNGSVAIAKFGAGESIDTETAQKPIIGFVFNNKGLMYNLTLEGAKITRLRQ